MRYVTSPRTARERCPTYVRRTPLDSFIIVSTTGLSSAIVWCATVNHPPEYCPYCGAVLDEHATPETSETTMVYWCDPCDDYVFYNPTPGGSVAVLDGDRLLLVEDFRDPGEWKLPEGLIHLGESPREGAARELEEETGLSVDPADLTYFHDESDGDGLAMDYAVYRSETSGTLEAGSDATDARFFTPAEFEDSEYVLKHTHVGRFGTDLRWIRETARRAIEARPIVTPPK